MEKVSGMCVVHWNKQQKWLWFTGEHRGEFVGKIRSLEMMGNLWGQWLRD